MAISLPIYPNSYAAAPGVEPTSLESRRVSDALPTELQHRSWFNKKLGTPLTGQKHLPVDGIKDPLRLDVETTEMFHLDLITTPIVDLRKKCPVLHLKKKSVTLAKRTRLAKR